MSDELSMRFWSKVDRSAGPDDCWPWQAFLHGTGYGTFWLSGRKIYAHRVAFMLANGSIDDALVVDHECHNRAIDVGECTGGNGCPHRRCQNPAHLHQVSQAENVRRARGLTLEGLESMAPRSATHCAHGHTWTAASTYICKRGSRVCRLCRNAAVRRWYQRQRASA